MLAVAEDMPLRLGALLYDSADEVDVLLADFATRRRAQGHRLGGFVQHNHPAPNGRRAMTAVDLMTGATIRLTQELGTGAGSCGLDTAALAEAAQAVHRALAAEVDLIIINKFGRQEIAGGGVRAEIAAAALSGIPVLTAVSRKSYCAWRAFTGGYGTMLFCAARIAEDWWSDVAGRKR